jgi:hypothetical protein
VIAFLIGFAAGGLFCPLAIIVGVDLAVALAERRELAQDEPRRRR